MHMDTFKLKQGYIYALTYCVFIVIFVFNN